MTTTAIQLVQTHGQQAFTTSLIIAEGVNGSHDHTLRLIEKYKSKFEAFGLLTSKVESTAGRPAKSYDLSEDQATFLMTLYRNSEIVVDFKFRLVKEFRKALDHIAENFRDPPRTGLIQDKRASMWDMTDALKEIRAEAGKDTKAYHYSTENKLLNWCIRGEFKPLDEKSLSNEEVELLRKVRIKDAAYIRADMDYAERKEKLKAYADRLRVLKLIP